MSLQSRRWTVAVLALAFAGASSAATASSPLRPLKADAANQLRAQQPQRAAQALQRLEARGELGLKPATTFQLRAAQTDRFGQLHARFAQLHLGLPVFGAEIVTHTDARGEDLADTNGLLGAPIKVSPTPTFDERSTLGLVRAELGLKGDFSLEPKIELVWYPERVRVPSPDRSPAGKLNAEDTLEEVAAWHLAYHVHTEVENKLDGVKHTDFMVDAHTGEIIKQWNSLETISGTGNSQYSGVVGIETGIDPFFGTGSPVIWDTTRGNSDVGIGAVGNFTLNYFNDSGASGLDLFYDSDGDNVWGDGAVYAYGDPYGTNAQTAAVDAEYGLERTWDYYGQVHSRDGIDDFGTSTYNRVHFDNTGGFGLDNAFWSNSCFCMTYGDGTGSAFGGFDSVTELDVAGHEMSHGVTAQTAQLIYSGESGGLNEANSDIHGTMVEFYSRGAGGTGGVIPNTGGNFTIGEQLSPVPLRWMYKPSLDGLSRDEWASDLGTIDVHYSSGPMNRAFYFLSQGAHDASTGDDYSTPNLPAGMTGIGNDSAARIWYRALTVYLTPSSDYVAARTAALRSASDLFGVGSPEYAAVQNAFAGINVGYTAGTFDDVTDPTAVAASVSGSSGLITFGATASDNIGVTRVEFYVDGVLAGTARNLPFSLGWDSHQVSNGSYSLFAVAYDRAGNWAYDGPIAFTVSNAGTELVTNGGFEQGEFGWTVTQYVINDPVSSGTHKGQGYAWLDGYGTTHLDSLSQDVTIPAGVSAGLSYFLKIDSQDLGGVANDTLVLTVRDPLTDAVLATVGSYSNLNLSSFFQQREVDLSAFAGRTVRLTWEGNEDASLATNFKMDDVSLQVTVGDTHAPESIAAALPAGTNLWLTTEILDDGAINRVQYLVDGTVFATATLPDTAVLVAVSTIGNGSHTLVSRVRDASGNEADSAPVSFVIDTTVANGLVNPNFTTGSSASGSPAWTNNGSAAPWVITAPAGFFIDSTHFGNAFSTSGGISAGNRLAILGGLGVPETASLQQDFNLPAGGVKAKLSFALRVFSTWTDGTVHDSLSVDMVDISSGSVIDHVGDFSNLDPTTGTSSFLTRTLVVPNFPAYASSPNVRLRITATEGAGADTNHFTRFRMDNFVFAVSQQPDNTSPSATVSVTGTYGTVSLRATASDDFGVKQVQFFVDGNPVGTVTAPPYQVTWTPTGDGTYAATAVATDYAGNNGSSAPVSFSIVSPVADTTPPTVDTLTESGSFETANLFATASDNDSVTSIELFIDGVFAAHCNGNVCGAAFDARGLSAGSHTLTANAMDGWNNVGTASTTFNHDPVQVTLAPVGALLYRGDSQSFSATVTNTDSPSQPVAWSVQEGSTGGAVDGAGLYTAPVTRGLFHVVGTSSSDPNASGSAAVTVYTVDVNDDGVIDAEDMALLAASYGQLSPQPNVDLDLSVTVDDSDVTLFNAHF